MERFWILLLLGAIYPAQCEEKNELTLQIVTVATDETDGYARFMQSAKDFGLQVEVVGMGQKWTGGDIANYPGGGQKINLLKPVLAKWKDDTRKLVMFTDSYDVIFASTADEIITKFLDFEANAVFSAEGFCWPDKALASTYPKVALGKRFLCSGGFIGYANVIYNIVSDSSVKDKDDDQLFYTKIYLDEEKRTNYSMKLDHRSHIFQNLNGAKEEIELKFEGEVTRGENVIYGTKPSVFHGNGPSKIFLNYLGNYLGKAWTEEKGCGHCKDDLLEDPKDGSFPKVFVGIFIDQPTPFLAQFFQRFFNISYPKDKITVYLRNSEEYHDQVARDWLKANDKLYSRVYYVEPSQVMTHEDAREEAMKEAIQWKDEYFLALDTITMITDVNLIQNLIRYNKNVIAPLVARPGMLWSNFWGAVASDGYYARSPDYSDLLNKNRIGVWNVPHVMNVYLMKVSWIEKYTPNYKSDNYDFELAFSDWMRNNGHFMFMVNEQEYGYLINPDKYSTEHLHNDMYEIFNNRMEWEREYLHPNWSVLLNEDVEIQNPCPDVYWFPLMSEKFTKELVGEMEHYGQWSGGTHNDNRLSGGYENVPTRDIHMNQVGFEDHWLEIIKSYVIPVNGKIFSGYYSKGIAIMNFVVKYAMDGQPSLRPHHDASTYTINVALSKPNVDHWGGGCRFIRYNCSVVDTKLGWALMHPGRLTHQHEGLPLLNGTRYIMVSFIDP